jgi:hypothetical protein
MLTEASVVFAFSGLLALAVLFFRIFKPKFPASFALKVGESGEHKAPPPPSADVIRREAAEEEAKHLRSSVASVLTAFLQNSQSEAKEWRAAILALSDKATDAHKDALTLTSCQAEQLVNRTLSHLETLDAKAVEREVVLSGRTASLLEATLAALPAIFAARPSSRDENDEDEQGCLAFGPLQGYGSFDFGEPRYITPCDPSVRPIVPSPDSISRIRDYVEAALAKKRAAQGDQNQTPTPSVDAQNETPAPSVVVERMAGFADEGDKENADAACKKGKGRDKDKDKGKDKPTSVVSLDSPSPERAVTKEDADAASAPASPSPSPATPSVTPAQAFRSAFLKKS